MSRWRSRLLTGLVLACAGSAQAYPLDGAGDTGIQRLEAARLTQAGELPGRPLPTGALLPTSQVRLQLADRPDFTRPPADPAVGQALRQMLGAEASRYGIAVLDVSDPDAPLYAEHRGDAVFNPGSVGKLIVALGVFQALADLYPDDVEARRRVLREANVVADEFILAPSHEVPFWSPGSARVVRRKIRVGDEANLWSYLDWTLSASSNSAASMVIQQLLLLRHFGLQYPASKTESTEFLRGTPRAELSSLLIDSLQTPVTRSGLSLDTLRQGGFFTSEAKRRIPGASSTATARSLVDFLIHLERGQLVDGFSSLELKRLMYLTDRRIRYASSPALASSAVYFKSGSLYRCAPEPGFECKKYHGNVENIMNSVAIVESPTGEAHRLFYLVAVTSNVLRKNSAVEHQTLGTRIHRLIEARHASSASEKRSDRPPMDR